MKKQPLFLLALFMLISNAEVPDEKSQEFEAILSREPNNATTLFEYGLHLANLNEEQNCNQAIEMMMRATQLQHNVNWQFSLGTLCCRVGRFHDALNAFEYILKKHPSIVSVLYNSGYTFKLAGNFDMAIAIYKTILAKEPDYAPAHLGLAFAYIQTGDFENGWREHKWNLIHQKKNALELRELLRTNNVSGKRILLVPEGGWGDTLQFIRYAQRLHDMGAYVIVAVQQPLIPLLSNCTYIDSLIATKSAMPAHDAKSTLMSLPAIFADTEQTIPQNIPYIIPNPERVTHWHNQLASDTNYKVGICWQPDVHNDVSRLPIARRGIPLSFFYSLGSIPGVTLYSLQKKEGLDQLRNVPSNVNLHLFDESFDVAHGSFVDTAAAMQEMDLIISTDTATAHLAGALGKKVWLLLPYVTDWRWLHNRTDSPWYPTMRIFKQPHPFDWKTMMNELENSFLHELHMK